MKTLWHAGILSLFLFGCAGESTTNAPDTTTDGDANTDISVDGPEDAQAIEDLIETPPTPDASVGSDAGAQDMETPDIVTGH